MSMGTSSSEGVSSERGMSRTSSSEEEEEEEGERGREEEERKSETLRPSEWKREANSGLLGGRPGGGAGAGGGPGGGAEGGVGGGFWGGGAIEAVGSVGGDRASF